jgi:catalase
MQRYRLGVNHYLIPVNAPRCPVQSYHRDGAMRVDGNHGSTLGYEPNSSGEWQEQPDFSEPPLALNGAADHWNHREDTDYYSQPGALFRLMTSPQQQVLFENTARSIGGAPRDIQIRHIGNCLKADPAYGAGIAHVLGISLNEVSK